MWKIVLLFLFAVLLSACAAPGPKISINADPDTNFSSFHTFAFLPKLGTDRPAGIRTPLSIMLVSAVTRELNSRGMYLSDSPDVLVNFYVNVEHKVDVHQVPISNSYYGYRYGLYSPWNGYSTWVYEYKQGTLSIDLIDPQRKMLIWEGVAQGRLSGDTTEVTQKKVDEVVSAIMLEFTR